MDIIRKIIREQIDSFFAESFGMNNENKNYVGWILSGFGLVNLNVPLVALGAILCVPSRRN